MATHYEIFICKLMIPGPRPIYRFTGASCLLTWCTLFMTLITTDVTWKRVWGELVNCLKVMPWRRIISVWSSARSTRTTIDTRRRVLWCAKEPGGTTAVIRPTWMASTWQVPMSHSLTVSIGVCGRATSTRWNSQRWRSDGPKRCLSGHLHCPVFNWITMTL